jgi:hypothetical protein
MPAIAPNIFTRSQSFNFVFILGIIFVEEMLNHANITVKLNTDFFDISREHDHIVFTGPIDRYFESSGLPKLEYRSINFIKEPNRELLFLFLITRFLFIYSKYF